MKKFALLGSELGSTPYDSKLAQAPEYEQYRAAVFSQGTAY
jgi:hypothetical protein